MVDSHTSLVPSINGLILAGGESTRMGMDKGSMIYHDLPQREHLWHLLRPFTVETFISCRPGQLIPTTYPILEDAWHDLGPFGAILTAFDHAPNSAWLAVACDFPLLDVSSVRQLIQQRNTATIATSFLDPQSGLPEPWISILEPAIYPLLKEYKTRHRSSLRGILQDHGSHVIQPLRPEILYNANTPHEAEELRRML